MSQDELYQWIADQDCSYQPEETLKQMHERLQREIKAEHAAAVSKANTDLLLAELGWKP